MKNEKLKDIVCLILISIILLFIFLFSMTPISVRADGTANDEEVASDYSFGNWSSIAAAALSTAYGAHNEKTAEETLQAAYGNVTAGAAGGLLAYTDKDNTKGIWGLFMAQLSLGSNTKEYKSLSGGGSSLIDKVGSGNIFSTYVITGAVLNDLGLDQTASAVETVGFMTKRGLIGSITLAAYILSQSVTLIFGFVIDVLKMLNPFGLFSKVNSAFLGSWNGLTKTAAGGSSIFEGAAGAGLSAVVSSLYVWIIDFAWIVLVILLAVIMFRFFILGDRQGFKSGVRKWITQALFIFCGIAVLGGTYTTILNALSLDNDQGNNAATKMVASTFCDFESWVMDGMKDISSANVKYKIAKGVITASDSTNTQEVCYQINKTIMPTLPGWSIGSAGSGTLVGDTVKEMRTGLNNNTASDMNAVRWCIDMLLRYQTGKKIYSSSYESLWKSVHWDESAASLTLAKFSECYLNSANTFNDGLMDSGAFKCASTFGTGGTGGWYMISGGASVAGSEITSPFRGGHGQTKSKSGNNGTTTKLNVDLSKDATSEGALKFGGFSAMSIYNYLNTTFDSTSLTVYSSTNSASNYVRDSHYSVNLVGKGMESTIFLITCLTLLITFTILGFVYGFGIIIANVTRGIRLVIAVPGAMLGSVQAIARVVSYTVIMIIEVVMNIVLYYLTTDMIFTVATQVISSFKSVTGSKIASILLTPSIGFITIIFLVWFTAKAVKLRKPIMKAIEEAGDNVVQKFILGVSAQAVSANPSVNSSSFAKGLGSGAGSSAASAGEHKGAKGVENFIPVYGAAKNADARYHAKKAKNEAEGNKMLADIGIVGGSSSAVTDEQNAKDYAAMKRKAKKDAIKAKMTGGLKTAVGTAEVAAGYMTGNIALGTQGAKKIGEGASDINNAQINEVNDIAAITNANVKAQGGQESIAAELAQSNNNEIEKFDVKKEAVQASGAVISAQTSSTDILQTADDKAIEQSVSKTISQDKMLVDGKTMDLKSDSIVSEESAIMKKGSKNLEAPNNKNRMMNSVSNIHDNVTENHLQSKRSIQSGSVNEMRSIAKTLNRVSNQVATNTHNVQMNEKTVISGGQSGNLGERALSHGKAQNQVVSDVVNVKHETKFNHISDQNQNGNYSGPKQIHGKSYTQNVQDSVNVSHNSVYEHHESGTANINGSVLVQNTVSNNHNQIVTDTVDVSHIIFEHDKPAEIHIKKSESIVEKSTDSNV